MSTIVRRGAAVSVAAVLLAGGVTACSSEAAVKKSDVAKQISQKVSATGEKVSDMKCDDNLKAKVGATTTCEGKVNGTKQKFKATVKTVEGKTVNYTISKG
ncbi:DUF4333 domain-containing protein [Calidifontibacter terrae]